MKNFSLFLLMIITSIGFSQEKIKEDSAKQFVIDFFTAFHAQDSTALKNMAYGDVILQSISTDSLGKTVVENETYSNFVKSIISIPASTQFEERLQSFDVTVNGKISTVITPYTFYINKQISHCGVNSFQLVETEERWKILYIVDTRIKEGCN